MNDFVLTVWHYLVKAGFSTLLQLFVLFGPLLLLAILMNYLSLLNQRLNYKVFGEKIYLYLFGWLGTAIHESGHALFALLFGHKINEIKLFKPDAKTGSLGYVKHSYNQKNLYHQTGNFFIGIGPVLMCILMLYLLSYLLFHINFFSFSEVRFSGSNFQSIALIKTEALKVWESSLSFLNEVIRGENSNWWKIALFVYCFYCIGSSITLSTSDMKTASKGFLIIVVLFFLFNCATIWKGDFAMDWLSKINVFLSGFYSIMILSLIINLFFTAVLLVLLLVFIVFKF